MNRFSRLSDDVGGALARQGDQIGFGNDVGGMLNRQSNQIGYGDDVGAQLARNDPLGPGPTYSYQQGDTGSYTPESYSPMGGIKEEYTPTAMRRGGPVGYADGGEVKDGLGDYEQLKGNTFRNKVLDAASKVVARPPAPSGGLSDKLGYNQIPQYANGGYVDPMGYLPQADESATRPQYNTYDPYNTIGRQEPQVSPFAMYAPDQGYARGGPVGYQDGGDVVDDQQPLDTGYVDPLRERPRERSALHESLDWLHRQFSPVSEAAAADNPPPQTGYGAQPNREEEWKVHTPPAPYEPPNAGGSGTTGIVPKEVPGVPTVDPSSPMGRYEANRPPPVSPDDSWGTIAGRGLKEAARSLPGSGYFMDPSEAAVRKQQFEPTAGWWDRTMYAGKKTITDMLQGDHPYTPEQVQHLQDRLNVDPNAGTALNKHWQDTFDNEVKTKGAEGGATVLQMMRPGYDKTNSLSVAAISANDPVNAAKFADMAHNYMPNNLLQTTQWDAKTGMFTTSLRNELSGETKSYQMNPTQFKDWRTGLGSQFDHVAAGGTDRTLQVLTNPYARKEGALPEGYQRVQLPDGRSILKGPQGQQLPDAGGGTGGSQGMVGPAQVPLRTANTGQMGGPPEAAFDPAQGGISRTTAQAATAATKPGTRDYATPLAFGTPAERRQKEAAMRAEQGRGGAEVARPLPRAMQYNVEQNIPGNMMQTGNWGTLDNQVKVQGMVDKIKPNIRDVQNLPVNDLSAEEIYAERQRLTGSEDPRAAMAGQQFQKAVAPGRTYQSDVQREQAARDYWAARGQPSIGPTQTAAPTPEANIQTSMTNAGWRPLQDGRFVRTGPAGNTIQTATPNDITAARAATAQQQPQQAAAQDRPMPLQVSTQQQQPQQMEGSRPATKADEPWFSTEGLRGGPPLVRTQEDLQKVPRGQRYRAPDGSIRVRT